MYVVIDHRTSCWQGAGFGQRVFVTLAGWRSAEPAGLTAAASHHCLSLLLTYLANHLLAAHESDAHSLGKLPAN